MTDNLETRPYDAAAYLKTDRDCALYLQAVMEEAGDDVTLIAAAIEDIAGARGMMPLVHDTGLAQDANLSFDTVLKVCKMLGLKLRTESIRVYGATPYKSP